jgi:small neutral amino acid transporter SnatA (MarC family)
MAAVVLGLAAFGGLIVLAVAGVSGATAVLVTGGAVVAMIGLGNLVGGRRTPDRAPYDSGAADDAGAAGAADDEDVEDVERAEQAAEGRQATPE